MTIEELKRLAEAASDVNWMHLCRENPVVFSGKYATYIDAANPAAVLELIRQRDELLASLKEARELVEDWGAYAPAYMQEKHDLEGDMNKLDAAIARAEAP
jgi:hypothetical protein